MSCMNPGKLVADIGHLERAFVYLDRSLNAALKAVHGTGVTCGNSDYLLRFSSSTASADQILGVLRTSKKILLYENDRKAIEHIAGKPCARSHDLGDV